MSPKKEIFIVNKMPLDDIDYILNLYYKNKLRNLKVLGTGSFSTVYEYKNYAIKYFEEDDCIDGEILEKLQGCKFFPKLFFYISEELVVMEKVEGVMLSEFDIKNIFYFEIKNVFEILEFCYNKKVIIDDIHEDNIMVDKNGNLKIIDVGLYKNLYKNISFFEYLIDNCNTVESLMYSIFNIRNLRADSMLEVINSVLK